MLVEKMGADNELVVKILAGKSPRDRAAELIQGTKLADVADAQASSRPAARMRSHASTDPMIQLALLVDPAARAVRKRDEAEVQEPMRQAYAKIAAGRFCLYGTNTYPDATFTLRLAFGTVKGYSEAGQADSGLDDDRTAPSSDRPSITTKQPFRLPASWLEHKDKLDLATPMNFVCTADIIGGNSGSPVVNRKGELVGLIFDGNIQSLVRDLCTPTRKPGPCRSMPASIIEALRKVYDAGDLADEIQNVGVTIVP